jgi:hypothetical protein
MAGGGDPEAGARIRVAAEACAEPKLRVALESIAAGEEDDRAVEEALAAGGGNGAPGPGKQRHSDR